MDRFTTIRKAHFHLTRRRRSRSTDTPAASTRPANARPIGAAVAVADRLAQGDLGVELSGRRGHGEAGRLLEAMRAMIENIRRILGRLVTTAERVAKRAELLRTTGQQISIGGENQSRATGTSFASMAEMTASIETVAGSTEDLTGRK